MEKFIADELSKCRVAKIPIFDDNTNVLYIKQVFQIKPANMMANHAYLIEVLDSARNNTVLSVNWNHGIKPVCNYYIVEKLSSVNNFYLLQGTGCQYNNGLITMGVESWYGYLPEDSFTIIKEVQ